MSETQTSELPPLVIPEYEASRLIIGEEVLNDPRLIQSRLNTKISECISNAPTFSPDDEVSIDPGESIKHSLVVKYPEDSHLFPIIEKQMFQQLNELNSELASQNAEVSKYTLMGLDSRTSSLSAQVDNGQTVQGETYFEHEQKHAQVAYEEGHGSVYIVMPLAWYKDAEGRRTLKFMHASAKIRQDLRPESVIAVGLAPRYPSESDFWSVRKALKSITNEDNISESLQMDMHLLRAYPRFNGKQVNAELMQTILLPIWEQLPKS